MQKVQAHKLDVLYNLSKEFIFKQDENATYGALTGYAFSYCMDFGLSYEHAYPFSGRRNLGKSMPSEDKVVSLFSIYVYKVMNSYIKY